MAFTLRGTQSSLWQPWGVRPHIPAPVPANSLGFASRRLPSLCCRAQKGDDSGERVLLPSQSWMNADSSYADTYAGWSLVEPDATDDFLRGVLKIGMAIALGIGISLASYSIYSRKGFTGTKNGLAFLPVALQRQGPSIRLADSAGHDETPTSTFEQNVENQMHAQASESISEEVTDFHKPDNSGQGPVYSNEDTDVNNSEALLSAAASAPLSVTSLELERVSSSNAEDPNLPESSEYGEVKQSERATKVKPGRVLVPAVVDQLQEQSLAALQNLKVVEADVEPGSICTRRQYARWLMAASRILAKNSAHKVFPAMYIENVSEPAFEDVSAEDPDFPFIQGLAEAGLISSRLSEESKDDMHNMFLFLPDSPLSRQDLVSWKIALERHRCPIIVDEPVQAISVFIDIEKIHKDALPALAMDVSAGEQSITAMAFGYTRRFQPDKPVTVAQTAIALTSGEGGEHVAEELARLAAEKLAEEAVATEIAMEAHAKKEANVAYLEELENERKCTAAAESLVIALRSELESLKIEREKEKYAILKDRAFVESEKEFVSHTKIENERLTQELSLEKVKVVFERERLEKLVADAEREKQSLTTVRSELEVEKKALTLARIWAEDEAKQARAHAKILEEARKRWEIQGIEVHVDQELDENNIPSPVWTYHQDEILSEDSLQRSQNLNIAAKAEDIRRKCKDVLDKLLEVSEDKFIQTRQKTFEALQEIWKKVVEIQQATYSVAIEKTSKLQKAATSAVAGFSSQVVEGTKKLADGCKDGAEKLVERFKT